MWFFVPRAAPDNTAAARGATRRELLLLEPKSPSAKQSPKLLCLQPKRTSGLCRTWFITRKKICVPRIVLIKTNSTYKEKLEALETLHTVFHALSLHLRNATVCSHWIQCFSFHFSPAWFVKWNGKSYCCRILLLSLWLRSSSAKGDDRNWYLFWKIVTKIKWVHLYKVLRIVPDAKQV